MEIAPMVGSVVGEVRAGLESAAMMKELRAASGGVVSTEVRDRFVNAKTLRQHFLKHGSEFGNITEVQYLQRAQNLVDSQPSESILIKVRANGDILFFDKITGDFAVKTSDNIIRTLFKPKNGIDYFLKQ